MLSLHENEKVLLEARRMWVIFAATVSSFFTFALVPVVVFLVADVVAQDIVRGSLLPLWVFLGTLWWLFVWIWFFVALANYYLDVFVVTTERVVHFTQHGLFHREISELRLSRIQDVTITVRGVVPTLLHYGDIRIETAGEVQEFTFRQIPYPNKVKELIMTTFRSHLREEHKKAAPTQQP